MCFGEYGSAPKQYPYPGPLCMIIMCLSRTVAKGMYKFEVMKGDKMTCRDILCVPSPYICCALYFTLSFLCPTHLCERGYIRKTTMKSCYDNGKLIHRWQLEI